MLIRIKPKITDNTKQNNPNLVAQRFRKVHEKVNLLHRRSRVCRLYCLKVFYHFPADQRSHLSSCVISYTAVVRHHRHHCHTKQEMAVNKNKTCIRHTTAQKYNTTAQK